jgi:hypothetical protein
MNGAFPIPLATVTSRHCNLGKKHLQTFGENEIPLRLGRFRAVETALMGGVGQVGNARFGKIGQFRERFPVALALLDGICILRRCITRTNVKVCADSTC